MKKRFVSLLLVALMGTGCFASCTDESKKETPPPTQAVLPEPEPEPIPEPTEKKNTLSVDKTIFNYGEEIYVTATAGDEDTSDDWVAIYSKGTTPSSQTTHDYFYSLNRGENYVGKKFNFSQAYREINCGLNLEKGNYVIYHYGHDEGAGEYTQLLDKVEITVLEGEADALQLDRTIYRENDPILVTARGDADDWIGICLKDADKSLASNFLAKYDVAHNGYVSGQTVDINQLYKNANGGMGLPAGQYDVHFFADSSCYNQYTLNVQASQTITIKQTSETGTLSLNKTTYYTGEDVVVTATGANDQWVGIYKRNEVPGGIKSPIMKYSVAKKGDFYGKKIKTCNFAEKISAREDDWDLPAGEYTAYLFRDAGYSSIKSVNFTVVPLSAPKSVTYTPSGKSYMAEGTLQVVTADGIFPDAYRVYWANEDGALVDYRPYFDFAYTNTTTSISMPKNTLVPVGADRILVRSVRGGVESLDYTTVALPQEVAEYGFGKVVNESQITSDIHLVITAGGEYNRHFRRAITDILNVSPNTSGLFLAGDISDWSAVGQYAYLKNITNEYNFPLSKVHCAIGNHDIKDAGETNEVLMQRFVEQTNSPALYYSVDVKGYTYIMLGSEATDATYKNTDRAYLSQTQLTWLDNTLSNKNQAGKPIFVFLHQPMRDTTARTAGTTAIDQDAELRAILNKYPEVVFVTGHSHVRLESANMLVPKGQTLLDGSKAQFNYLNAPSTAYIWGEGRGNDHGGAQGYYAYFYEDKLVLRGRDYINNQWVPEAQFVIDYAQ